MKINELEWLQDFLRDLTSEGWGNNVSVKISTISNPGWAFEVALEDTVLSDVPFERTEIENSEDEWYVCWVKDKKFYGMGGVMNLSDLIKIFINWVEKSDKELL